TGPGTVLGIKRANAINFGFKADFNEYTGAWTTDNTAPFNKTVACVAASQDSDGQGAPTLLLPPGAAAYAGPLDVDQTLHAPI
ncbi:hypothetical protein, partial [Streptomyces hilarionis]|uniref:hypothetical protein n=1 Tax=Streptomyces hilarionis TaxID=2839954 RepID=UPI00211A00E9